MKIKRGREKSFWFLVFGFWFKDLGGDELLARNPPGTCPLVLQARRRPAAAGIRRARLALWTVYSGYILNPFSAIIRLCSDLSRLRVFHLGHEEVGNMNRRRILSLVLVIAIGLLPAGPARAAAGDQLWETTFDFLPEYNHIQVAAMVASPTAFIICGYAKHWDAVAGAIGFIKAFEVAQGALKWEKTLTLGANSNTFHAMTLDGDLLFVLGGAISAAATPPGYSLFKSFRRCYNADTGQQLWEVIADLEASPNVGPAGPLHIVVANNRVFNLAIPLNNDGTPVGNCKVRAYQARNASLPASLLLE
jgi:hypothetical protein